LIGVLRPEKVFIGFADSLRRISQPS